MGDTNSIYDNSFSGFGIDTSPSYDPNSPFAVEIQTNLDREHKKLVAAIIADIQPIKALVAAKILELEAQKAQKQSYDSSIITTKAQIKAAEIEEKSNQAKIAETKEELRLKEAEKEQAKQDKLDYVVGMNAKQKSFVLQKAMETHDSDIIDLLRLTDFDINFQNAEGQSLIDTATILGDQPMLDYLNGHE